MTGLKLNLLGARFLSLSLGAWALVAAAPQAPLPVGKTQEKTAVSKDQRVSEASEASRVLEWKRRENAAQEQVTARCQGKGSGDVRTPGLLEWIRTAIESDVVLRKALVQFLRQSRAQTAEGTQSSKSAKGATASAPLPSPCDVAVREILTQLQAAIDSGSYEKSKNRYRPYILLAVATGMPEGAEILGRLLLTDHSGDWLVALRSFDGEIYGQVLDSVATRLAAQLREELGLGQVDTSLYGQIKSNVFTEKRVRFNNPLFIHSYLAALAEREDAQGPAPLPAPSSTVWANLNIFYSTMGIQDKSNATALMVKIIKGHDSEWIASFRKEPVWVQYRLLAVVRLVGGAEMVRELMWLSENSIDDQIKTLAASTLDEILKMDAKPRSAEGGVLSEQSRNSAGQQTR